MCRRLIILLTFLSVIVLSSEIIDIQENKTIAIKTYMHIRSKPINGSSFFVFPGSINPNNLATCKTLNKSEFGPQFSFPPCSAVLVFGYNGCSHFTHAKLVQDVGGSIAIIATPVPFLDPAFKFGIEKLTIPVLFISFPDAIELLKTIGKNAPKKIPTRIKFEKEYNVMITLESGGFWIFLEIALLISYLVNFVLGIRSLFLHFQKEGLKLSISQTTVWINLFSTFLWSMAIFDPWNIRYIAKSNFVAIILSLIQPSLLTSVLFLSFFFNEVLIARGFIKPQLTTLKYPFLIVCLTFWGCYLAEAYFLGSNNTNFTFVKLIIMMNITFFGVTGIYFATMSILVLARLRTFNSPVIKRLIPLVAIVLFGIIVFIAGSILQAVKVYRTYDGRSWFASWTLMFVSSAFVLTPQFVYFREPYTSKSSKPEEEKQDVHLIDEK